MMYDILLSVQLFQKILQVLERWDTELFLLVNTVWTTPFLDNIFPWWREANTWIPLYLFLVIFALMNFGRKAIPWILFVVLTFAITDQVSSTLVKGLVARVRPCNDAFLMTRMRLLLANCGAGYSFTSSHATNHFGLAIFVFITLRRIFKSWSYAFLVWAASISYAQVYVGVHYPVDVICGGLLGAAIGYGTGIFFNRRIGPVVINAVTDMT